MELEELKSAWAQYDKRLSQNLTFNEELLRSINFEKYTQALRKPLNLDLLNIFIQVIAIGYITFSSIRLSNEIPYFLIGLMSALMCIISMIFSVVKVIRLNKLFYYHICITDYQKKITELRVLIMRLRKLEYVIAAILGITLLPLFLKANSGIDLLGNLTVLIPAICFAIGFGYAIGIWLNLFFYDKGLMDADKFLSIIDKFGKEE